MSPVVIPLLLLIGLPALAGLLEATRFGCRRSGTFAVAGATAALFVVAALAAGSVLGDEPTMGDAAAPSLRADGLALVLAGIVATIGVTVLSYARRALDPGTDAVRMASAGSIVLASTLAVATAGRLSVLVAAWLVTTTAVLVLLHHRSDPARRAAARRTGVALGIGDAALVAATIIVIAVAGDPALDGLGSTAATLADRSLTLGPLPDLSLAGLVASLLVLAALARAAQLPLPSWLPGTLASPTATSALLHAGVVNAGAILLVRSFDLISAAPLAAWTLAVFAMATVVRAAAAALARPDSKGSMALSTSAQMGFMLIAIAVGAPAAGITHLVGHALYKSARFLGVGGSIAAAVRSRRFVATAGPISLGRAAVAATAALAVAAVTVAAAAAVLPDPEAAIVGLAMGATAATALWSWLRRPPTLSARQIASAAAGVAGVAALALAVTTGVESVVVASLPGATRSAAPAVAVFGALTAIALGGAALDRSPRCSPWLWAQLAVVGRPRAATASSFDRTVVRSRGAGSAIAPRAADAVAGATTSGEPLSLSSSRSAS
jgi:NADH:ubiquinone oxidoreductase subunit 5 (subunit L)/multisubunit Na+/H+ antiporter MnhA subunit